jgi:hypothetical protein
MSQKKGVKGKGCHPPDRLVYPPEKKSVDVDRIAQRAEDAQRRQKAGYWV